MCTGADRWAWVVDAGRDPATGKRRQKTKGGFVTKKDAEKALRDFLTEFEAGTFVAPSTQTVREYLDGWLITAATYVRPTTLSGYGRDVVNIGSKIGGVRLGDLTAQQVERAYADLMLNGGPAGRPLSAKTVKNVHTVLRRALGDAERLGIVNRNVVRMVRPPTAHRPPVVTWTLAQLGSFLASVEDHRLRAVFYVLSTTG